MLRWAFIFLVVGIVAGLLGFIGAGGTAYNIAEFLFFAFLAMWLTLLGVGYSMIKK